jgi:hypothetical protein
LLLLTPGEFLTVGLVVPRYREAAPAKFEA